MKTKILKIKGDWQEILNDCRHTVGKSELGKEPSEKFKKAILISEHSPIRDYSIKWLWEKIPHWIGVHWVRHKWECFVETQRSDRTPSGTPRSEIAQDEPQNFRGEMNIQNAIDTMRKRLCYQAAPETREYAEDFKITVHDEVDENISNVFVPNCIYRCGCPEMGNCTKFGDFMKWLNENNKTINWFNIQNRYDLYNEWFYETHQEEK